MSSNLWDSENIICTNKEQSTTLARLGLDYKTADMCILTEMDEPKKFKVIVSKFDDALREYLEYSVMPAWSTQRLLDFIPEYLDFGMRFAIKKLKPQLYINDLYEVGFYNTSYTERLEDSNKFPGNENLTTPVFVIRSNNLNECLVKVIQKLVTEYKHKFIIDVHGPKIGLDLELLEDVDVDALMKEYQKLKDNEEIR